MTAKDKIRAMIKPVNSDVYGNGIVNFFSSEKYLEKPDPSFETIRSVSL